MDVMETLSVHDLFQGLSSTNLLDSGFHDDDNRDSLLDLLSQSFPDMLTQSYGHLSSLPLDIPDLQLCIQDEDYQECDSADDIILQEFAYDVQNILFDTERSNFTNAPGLGECILGADLLSPPVKAENHFSPVKKLCPDQIDLLGPLLDEDEEEDIMAQGTAEHFMPAKACSLIKPNENAALTTFNTIPAVCRKSPVLNHSGKPLVAYVKPVLKENAVCEPAVPMVIPEKASFREEIRKAKLVVNAVKVEEESSDEVDIETVDDDELNGRSGAEVLSAKLADFGCQAARVRAILPRMNFQSKSTSPVSPAKVEKCHTAAQVPLASKPTVQSFPPLVKPCPKPNEKEPALVVEKIKLSTVAPRSSILIPHRGPPQQSRGKACKQEFQKVVKSNADTMSSASLYDARTLDHDYCNVTTPIKEPADSLSQPLETEVEQQLETVCSSFGAADDDFVDALLSDFDVPSADTELCLASVQSDQELTETKVIDDAVSRTCEEQEELEAPVVKSEKEVSLGYCRWPVSRSPSPYSQDRYRKREARKRSSCSPSSVSSHSVYRSRSRSSSHGRKGRSQTHHRRKQSRGRSRSRHSNKRSHYVYSRSSSRSSFSSRSPSPSLSRSRSRTRSQSRSRHQSWDYKRTYNRTPVTSYNWPQDKRRYDEKTREIEERRVVYVGRLPDGTTKNDLRHRFGCFGPIQEVSVHFRDSGHNYGFVTFSLKRDAYQAVEHGNDDPNQPKFDLSFGGRRQFCKQRYADLDSQYNNYSVQRPTASNDFDSLLQAAKRNQKC